MGAASTAGVVETLVALTIEDVFLRNENRIRFRASFRPVKFNVECKIEEGDASEAALRHYASQASEYQNTNAAFAILLVMDKTEHAEGTVNLFESIWIEQVQRNGESTPCRVVTIRVPGGRDDPSSLRAPDRRP